MPPVAAEFFRNIPPAGRAVSRATLPPTKGGGHVKYSLKNGTPTQARWSVPRKGVHDGHAIEKVTGSGEGAGAPGRARVREGPRGGARGPAIWPGPQDRARAARPLSRPRRARVGAAIPDAAPAPHPGGDRGAHRPRPHRVSVRGLPHPALADPRPRKKGRYQDDHPDL